MDLLESCFLALLTLLRPVHKTSRADGRHREEVEDDEEGHLIYKPGDTLQGRYVVRESVPCLWIEGKYCLAS